MYFLILISTVYDHNEKNVVHWRPIIYGSKARPIDPNDKVKDASHTHCWWVYVRGVDGYDISTFVRKVTFKLHESFDNPLRVVSSPPFEVRETGWGDFEILIKIYLCDTSEKPVQLYHVLRLYPMDKLAPSDQLVVSENYEEIVFNEPSAYMHGILVNNPYPKKRRAGRKSEISQDQINKEFEQLEKACEKLKNECDTQRQIIEELKSKIRAIKGYAETPLQPNT